MIFRPSTLLWMMMWVVAAFGLYMVKYKVQAVKVEVASAEKQLREETKDLHVLKAEWTYLNRPERLHALSDKYLDNKPIQGNQVSDLASLPLGNVAADEGALPAASGVTLASGAAHDE